MLLGSLTVDSIRDVQNILSRYIKRKKFLIHPTDVDLKDDEDWWWEWDEAVSETLICILNYVTTIN